MRGQTARRWVKLHVNGFLMGSVRWQLTPAERSVWIDLICLAGLGGTPGVIADNDNRPYPHSFIANRLNVPRSLLNSTLKKCKDEGRIIENGEGIHITHWTEYQSEYERQKPSRDKKRGQLSPEQKELIERQNERRAEYLEKEKGD